MSSVLSVTCGATLSSYATGTPGADVNDSFTVGKGHTKASITPSSTYIGYYSGFGGTPTGLYNTLVGSQCCTALSSGTYNTSIGYNNGPNVAGGLANTMVGSLLCGALTSGSINTVVGCSTGSTLTDGQNNVLIGYMNATGTSTMNAVAIGFQNTVTANSAVGIGPYCVSNGVGTVAIGNYANAANLGSIAIGANAGKNTDTATRNTYIGESAGEGVAGSKQTVGWNTAIGYCALKAVTSTGAYNTTLGYVSGTAITDGQYNVCIGYACGMTITTGDLCTCIGPAADCAANTQSAVALGYNAKATYDNSVALGNSAATPAANIFSIGTVAIPLAVRENATSHVYYMSEANVAIGATVTIANMLCGIVVIGAGAGTNLQLDSAANVVAGIPGCAAWHTIRITFYNATGNFLIFVAGAGGTIIGNTVLSSLRCCDTVLWVGAIGGGAAYHFLVCNP